MSDLIKLDNAGNVGFMAEPEDRCVTMSSLNFFHPQEAPHIQMIHAGFYTPGVRTDNRNFGYFELFVDIKSMTYVETTGTGDHANYIECTGDWRLDNWFYDTTVGVVTNMPQIATERGSLVFESGTWTVADFLETCGYHLYEDRNTCKHHASTLRSYYCSDAKWIIYPDVQKDQEDPYIIKLWNTDKGGYDTITEDMLSSDLPFGNYEATAAAYGKWRADSSGGAYMEKLNPAQ